MLRKSTWKKVGVQFMTKVFALSAIILLSVTTYSKSVYAETWNSDWGPVIVEADGNIFVGRYNMPVGGIVVMEHQGNGNYWVLGSFVH